MIANKPIETVIKDTKTDGPMSIGQLIEILDRYGIAHAERNIRISKKNPVPSPCSILTVHTNSGYSHWAVLYHGKYYDPEFGLIEGEYTSGKITSFLSVIPVEGEIDFSTLTACGECCTGCEKKKSGLCEGCIESDGHCKEWEQSGRCPVYACAKAHGVPFCGICPAFPCKELPQKIHWNPNIVERLYRLAEEYRKCIH